MSPLSYAAYDVPIDRERGSILVEYAIVVALVSIIALAGVRALGETTRDNADCVSRNLYGDICLSAAGNGNGP